ncbi:MAG: phage major capsid protein [Gammaproteobacteria bacterium]|nr:phage major capsid protein [Gammaproteobacteria bacterium]MDH5803461.1 phage major capsid protein [Gammaproteobacteria bacterium]
MDPIRLAVEELGGAFNEFKENNEARLESVISQVNALETAANRARFGGGGGTNQRKHSKDFENKALREFIQSGDVSRFQASMSVDSDPGGGYLVLPTVSEAMTVVPFETSPMRNLARVVDISTDRFEEPIDKDEADANWVGERETRGETDAPDVAMFEVPVHEIEAAPKVTQKLIEDSRISIVDWLTGKVTDKFTRKENTAFVSGTGVKQPRGFLAYDTATTTDATRPWGTLQYVASGAAGAFASSNPTDNLLDLVYSLKSDYRAGASWLMNRDTARLIRQFKDGQGNYLWQPSTVAGEPDMLLGFPVALGEDMPAIAADSYSIAFGNFKRGYTIVDRIGVKLLLDPYTSKPFVILYTYKRVGGAVNDFHAIKLMKFAAS